MCNDILLFLNYSPFHKTLPKSSLQLHWISVRFYEMGDKWQFDDLTLFPAMEVALNA